MIRSVKKTKEQLDESTQRIDRRVNEITEMHRLNEDHFRQEWTTYKADDHKRWANYNLVQEETQKEVLNVSLNKWKIVWCNLRIYPSR